MVIEIVKCSDPLFWYDTYIGEKYTVREYDDYDYVVRDSYGFINIIRKVDAKVINE